VLQRCRFCTPADTPPASTACLPVTPRLVTSKNHTVPRRLGAWCDRFLTSRKRKRRPPTKSEFPQHRLNRVCSPAPKGIEEPEYPRSSGLSGILRRGFGCCRRLVVNDLFCPGLGGPHYFAFCVGVLRYEFQGVSLPPFCVELLADFIFQLVTGLCPLCVSGQRSKQEN